MGIHGYALAALLVAATPLAQTTPTPPRDTQIAPVVWELVELPGDDGTPTPTTDASRYTIQFLPDNTVAVGADCNRAGGTYAIDGESTIDVTLTASTLALCSPDSRSEPFQHLLDAVTTFHQDADGHLLLSGEGGTMRLRPALAGVVWEWQNLKGGDDSIVRPKGPEDYTLTFLPEGKLAIKADCNRATGTYGVDGPRIGLKIDGVTRALCPPGSLMDDYLRDLEAVSSYVFRNGNLYLALPADAGIMEFKARYVAPGQATPEAG